MDELPNLATCLVFALEGFVPGSFTLQVEGGDGATGVAKRVDLQFLIVDFVRVVVLLAAEHIREFPVYEIPLDDVLDHFLHEFCVLPVSVVQDFCQTHDLFTMHLNSDIRSMIGLIVATFADCPKGAIVNLLLGNMAFNL